MSDYPDFTYRGDIDIIAQTIGNLAVDVVAQTLAALKVDITAQTLAQLNVDIIAQTLSEMAVNITAQDLAQLVIKIAAQTVGVYVERDWASTQDNDKSLTGSVDFNVFTEVTVLTYTVPAGKILYIDDLDLIVIADALFRLKLDSTTIWQMHGGAETPLTRVFTTPKKLIADEVVTVTVQQVGTPLNTAYANLGGREYTA